MSSRHNSLGRVWFKCLLFQRCLDEAYATYDESPLHKDDKAHSMLLVSRFHFKFVLCTLLCIVYVGFE